MRKNNHNLNQVKNYLFVFFVLASLLFFFHKPFEIFVDYFIVDTLLKYPKSWWVNDLIFFAFHLIGIYWIIQKIKIGYTASIKYLGVSIFLTTTYLAYREFYKVWDLVPLASTASIKYLDFLISISIGQIVLTLTKKKPKKNNKNALFHDQPIGFDGEDILGYSKYAELVSDKILNSSFKNAFAIGINGKWGIGKTSFIDLIKRNTSTDKNVIEVNFNAWNSQDSSAIVTDFFNLMVEEITPFHDSLPQTFSKYSSQLLELDNGSNSSIGVFLNLFKKDSSLVNLQNEIDNSLKEIGKKIIVFIDDVDRLNKKEIQEVVKLIRNTANFRNTFFVVAYDRNYVLNALKALNNFNINSYLEKIFQLEINLPSFENNKLRNELVNKLRNHFPVEMHNELERTILTTPTTGDATYLQEWLTTPRDVTRLANALTLNMNKLLGEVHFPDFLRLELLRLKYPFVYEQLHLNKDQFIEISKNNSRHFQPYILKKVEGASSSNLNHMKQLKDGNPSTEIRKYLKENKTSLHLKNEDIIKIEEFLVGIFFDGSFTFNQPSHLSIRNPKRFRLYFSYGLLDGTLSEVDFLNAINTPKENLERQIKNWVNDGLYDELRDRYEKLDSYANKEEYEKVIKSIFFLVNYKLNDTPVIAFRKAPFDESKLIDKLDNYNNLIVSKYYNYKGGNIDFIRFIKSLFEEATTPFEFEAELIYEYNSRNNTDKDHFPTTEYLTNMVEYYFKKYIESAAKVDMFVWKLYHCCKRKKWKKTGANSSISDGEEISDEINKIFKEFASKHIDSFILSLISIEPRKKNSYTLSDFVIKLFDSWQEVIELFDKKLEIEKDEILEEYKNFISKYSKAGKQYIEFDFQLVDIESKFK